MFCMMSRSQKTVFRLDYLHGSSAPFSAYWKNCQVQDLCQWPCAFGVACTIEPPPPPPPPPPFPRANNPVFLLLALCQVDEDCDGQRILFSQSATGLVWSFPAVLFPNMTVR